MKSYLRFFFALVCPLAFVLALAFSATSCSSANSAPVTAPALTGPKPCALALAAQTGDTALDHEITSWQKKARAEKKDQINLSLEQLGWKYIEKARATYDPGYFKLAAACAECLSAQNSAAMPEALLLRGHALHQMHDFIGDRRSIKDDFTVNLPQLPPSGRREGQHCSQQDAFLLKNHGAQQ